MNCNDYKTVCNAIWCSLIKHKHLKFDLVFLLLTLNR